MLKIMGPEELCIQYCKLNNCFGIFISWLEIVPKQEVLKAAPYLTEEVVENPECWAFVSCETEEEMTEIFESTAGDEHWSHPRNPYNGPVSVFALTIGPEGLRNSNT